MSAADHGNYTTYVHHKCRCEACRAAQSAYASDWRSRVFLAPGDSRHGTHSGYTNYGCRCAACRAAKSEVNRAQYQARKARKASAS